MKANVELLIQPYSVINSRSLIHLLIKELLSNDWNCFRAAVAFARSSGNYEDLLRAMKEFANQGGKIDLTFGADRFSGESGSDYDAIKELLITLNQEPTARLFLYHEPNRTFHPKLYLFANEDKKRALLIVGSSNWSKGGFWDNIEVNVVIDLDLADSEQNQCYHEVQNCIDKFWVETENER